MPAAVGVVVVVCSWREVPAVACPCAWSGVVAVVRSWMSLSPATPSQTRNYGSLAQANLPEVPQLEPLVTESVMQEAVAAAAAVC